MERMIEDEEVEARIKKVRAALDGLHLANANIVLIELAARNNVAAANYVGMDRVQAVNHLLEAVFGAHEENWEKSVKAKVN